MVEPVRIQRVDERACDVGLPDELLEVARTPLAGKHLVAHGDVRSVVKEVDPIRIAGSALRSTPDPHRFPTGTARRAIKRNGSRHPFVRILIMALVQSVVPVGELDPRTCRPRTPAMAGNGTDPAANRAAPGLKVTMGTLAARLPEERVATRRKPSTARGCRRSIRLYIEPRFSTREATGPTWDGDSILRATILHTRGDGP